MLTVTLSDATKTNGLLSRAVIEAVNALSQRQGGPPWVRWNWAVIRATSETLQRVFDSDEGDASDYRSFGRLFGLEVEVDNTVRPNTLEVLDPRTFNKEVIEVR